jgi:signal transduction histidine kinase
MTVIRDIEGMFQLSCKQKKIQCKVTYSERVCPPDFLAMRKRLRQLLVNLIGNAVKFTEQGIVSLQLEFQQHDEQKYALHFSIKDTGKGIPKDQITAHHTTVLSELMPWAAKAPVWVYLFVHRF